MVTQIPNLLSVVRLLLVPWFAMLLLERQFGPALILFAVMGASDGLDGYLARRLNAVSQFGARVDPLADKVLLIASFVILGHINLLEAWLVLLVVGRDVLIIGGALAGHLFFPTRELLVLKTGKVNTFAQIVLVLLVLINQLLSLPGFWLDGMFWVVVATTVVSALWYGQEWIRVLLRNAEAHS